jgi:hypothetical protein
MLYFRKIGAKLRPNARLRPRHVFVWSVGLASGPKHLAFRRVLPNVSGLDKVGIFILIQKYKKGWSIRSSSTQTIRIYLIISKKISVSQS